MQAILPQLEEIYGPNDPIATHRGSTLARDALLARCDRLAATLEANRVRVLALHCDNSSDWLIADLTAQRAGICIVPLPLFFSADQIRHVLRSAPVDAVLTDDGAFFASLLPVPRRSNLASGTEGKRLLLIDPVADPDSLPPGTGKVTFTSGSTGTPKGVCLSHAQLLKQAHALVQRVDLTRPRHLSVLPLATLLENVAGIYAPLLAGGEILLPGLGELGFTGSSTVDPGQLLRTISRSAPNTMILTPQLLLLLTSAATAGWSPPSSLQLVAVGGSRVSPLLIEKAHALDIPAYEGYGLSECASVVSLNTPVHHDATSSGRPLQHLGITIENGEIVVAGNAMLGYLGAPESWGQREIRTGDLGHIDPAGYLHIEGRSKNLLISSFGRNIHPEWVESELLADPTFAECVLFGDDRPYCVALITVRDPAISDRELQTRIDALNSRLPDYANIRRWHRLSRPLASQPEFVTANGRPRRTAIRERYGDEIEHLYQPCRALGSDSTATRVRRT